jgi:hypothetical protein
VETDLAPRCARVRGREGTPAQDEQSTRRVGLTNDTRTSDPPHPGADAGATGSISADRDPSPLERERGQVGRVVLIRRPGPEVAVHRGRVPHIEGLECGGLSPGGEGEVVVLIEACRPVAGSVLEPFHPVIKPRARVPTGDPANQIRSASERRPLT